MIHRSARITQSLMSIILVTACVERTEQMQMTIPIAHAEKETQATSDSNAQLELRANASEFKKGSTANVELILRNRGPAVLWINQRLLVNATHVPPTMREIWLEVKGPDHTLLPFTSKIRAGQAETKYFKVLKPTEEKKIQVDLAQYFDLIQSGTYRVTAYYQDGSRLVPTGPAGVKHLSSKLCSNTLEIAVH